jgi:acyl-[acyl carrier protein]--UDP-N-acetylglucosamine O-acyltransferase
MNTNIHATALVDPKATIASNVEIGPYSIIYGNVEIEDGCKIGPYCEIGVPTPLGSGAPLKLGKNSLIRSHSVFYESSEFGEKLITGHRVTVRENTIAGENLQIGTLTDIQGDCQIGDYVRCHSNVHIGKQSSVGSFVWIFPYVVLTNDPHPPSEVLKGVIVEDYAVIATMSVILPGVRVGSGSLIGASSVLKIDAESDMVYAGNPARLICSTKKIRLQDGTRREAYPWRKHFTRGYPHEIVNLWNSNEE